MTSFEIPDGNLDGIKGQVVLITGASSGIGLATLRRVRRHGGKVFAGDFNPLPEPEASEVPFFKADVTSWGQQIEMFKAAEATYGKIDHVFANAGVAARITLLEDDVDENGDLLPPDSHTINVNLLGCLYTVKLGLHYLKKSPSGGSIVMTASGSSFTRFPTTDYTTAKHGVLGIMRSLRSQLYPKLPIRINAVSPSWTDTGVMPRYILEALGEGNYQAPDIVGRSVTLLMADPQRHGELLYSKCGHFMELENGPAGFHAATARMMGVGSEGELAELKVFDQLAALVAEEEKAEYVVA